MLLKRAFAGVKLKLLVVITLLVAVPVGVILALSSTGFLSRAFGIPANLLVDLGSSYNVSGGVWKNLAQGGEENTRMLAPVVDKVKALDADYIRLDHVLDYYDVVSRSSDGKLVFNFTKLDLTLGDILASNSIPFISISYMPPALSKGNVTDLPTSWIEWESVVEKLVEHISGRGDLNITNVYYEVWNEPDLFGKYRTYGEKSYLDLYFHTQVGALRAKNTNSFKFGGPATTGLYDAWMKDFLKFTSSSNLRLDFISWHRYSKRLDNYEDDWVKAKGYLSLYPSYVDVELIISEFGPNSENDKTYDNGFGAIHEVAVSALLEGDINRLFAFEIKDGPGPEKFWGRWGIITHEKWGAPEIKPRYKAIQFLNSMHGKKVNIAGEGSWVKAFAKEKDGLYKILIVNYDPSGKHFESVPLTLTNIPYKSFVFKRRDYSGTSKQQNVTIDGVTWSTTEGFEANTAAIFEVTPL